MNVVQYGRISLGANLPDTETSIIKAFEKRRADSTLESHQVNFTTPT